MNIRHSKLLILIITLSIINIGMTKNKLPSQNNFSKQEWNDIRAQVGQTSLPSYIKASNSEPEDLFGYAMDIYGDTMVISALYEDSGAMGVNGDETDNSSDSSGAVYVFVKVDGHWQKQAYLKAFETHGLEREFFGGSVAIHKDTIVIGAQDASIFFNGEEQVHAGAVYVYFRENGIWSTQAKIVATIPEGHDNFGYDVDIYEDTIVIGSIFEDSNSTGINGDEINNLANGAGAAYVFTRENNEWSKNAYLKPSTVPSEAEVFGISVAIDQETIIVGASQEDSNASGVNGNPFNNSSEDSGAVYVFVKTTNSWRQQAYLKASNPDINDFFGRKVDISGNTVVVNSINEYSASTGVNGNQDDNSSPASGAVYVFIRNNDQWSQQAYLKASNTDSGDLFGNSVGIDDDIIVVSSVYEDSNATGINGDENNNLLENSGAVYVFKRTGEDWLQTTYIKSPNSDVNDLFGDPIAISGNNLIVGSWLEDSNATGIDGDGTDNSANDSGAAYVYDLEADGFAMQSGHSALWYDPNQNGHGINVYMLADNRILVFWYVYDFEGNPIWLLGIGSHDGVKATLDVNITDGAMFPPNFDPDDVSITSWGKFELEFFGCNSGLFKWMPVAENGFSSGEMNVVRLNNTLGLDCIEGNAKVTQYPETDLISTSNDFSMQAGLSALWYNPDQNGHGINVYMLDETRILVVWYVYDNEGRPLWLLGIGSHDGITATLDVSITNGAMFPPDFDPDDVDLIYWGQFELEFSGCNEGLFKWMPTEESGFTAGNMDIFRLNNTLGLDCSE